MRDWRKEKTVALALFGLRFPVPQNMYFWDVYCSNLAAAPKGPMTYGTTQRRFEFERTDKGAERPTRRSEGHGGQPESLRVREASERVKRPARESENPAGG